MDQSHRQVCIRGGERSKIMLTLREKMDDKKWLSEHQGLMPNVTAMFHQCSLI